MAKKKTPSELRDEAKILLEKAQKEENDRCQKIGQLFVEYVKNGFKGFELADFKTKAQKIWNG